MGKYDRGRKKSLRTEDENSQKGNFGNFDKAGERNGKVEDSSTSDVEPGTNIRRSLHSNLQMAHNLDEIFQGSFCRPAEYRS